MDALTLGTPILLRHLTFSEARKMPIREVRSSGYLHRAVFLTPVSSLSFFPQFHLEQALQEMNMTMDQFIDLGILLGCDYVDRIPGIGPVKAYEMIKKWKTIEEILKRLDKKKYKVPEEFTQNFAAARELFKNPDVTPHAVCALLL
jgi:flap endonuclease-1